MQFKIAFALAFFLVADAARDLLVFTEVPTSLQPNSPYKVDFHFDQSRYAKKSPKPAARLRVVLRKGTFSKNIPVSNSKVINPVAPDGSIMYGIYEAEFTTGDIPFSKDSYQICIEDVDSKGSFGQNLQACTKSIPVAVGLFKYNRDVVPPLGFKTNFRPSTSRAFPQIPYELPSGVGFRDLPVNIPTNLPLDRVHIYFSDGLKAYRIPQQIINADPENHSYLATFTVPVGLPPKVSLCVGDNYQHLIGTVGKLSCSETIYTIKNPGSEAAGDATWNPKAPKPQAQK